ncbi:MAG: aminotransferase class I/II-fold pyridoxal phosphate-dependent enzyme [Spirochaetes bacterium]|nr:aminotransferase class I/II-fold pyridoxal phosphate-dependent enzyme [Spirochaetota bacterium]
MNKFTKNIEDTYFPPIVEFKAEAAKRLDYSKPVFNLNQAIPNYQPPDVLKKAIRDELEKPSFCFYTFDEGIPELRDAIADSLNRTFAKKVSRPNICVVPGANNAYYSMLPVLASAGDEVILLTPYYFSHYMALKVLGIRPVEIILDPSAQDATSMLQAFSLPYEKIEAAITAKTKAVVFVNPCNPTGKSYTQAEVDKLYEICRKKKIYLVSDEVYSCFHDSYPRSASVLNNNAFPEYCVCINSFSKTYSITGLRVGFICASEEFIYHFIKVQDSNVVCVSTLSQAAALAGLKFADEWLNEKIVFLRNKKEKFVNLFEKSVSSFKIVSSGSFFVYLNYANRSIKAKELCFKMMEKENIIALPGEYFGSDQDYAIRLALGNLLENEIEPIIERLARITWG